MNKKQSKLPAFYLKEHECWNKPALWRRWIVSTRKQWGRASMLSFSEVSEENKSYIATRKHYVRICKPTINLGTWVEKAFHKELPHGGFKNINLQRVAFCGKLVLMRQTLEVRKQW